jgi:hypothetical protein
MNMLSDTLEVEQKLTLEQLLSRHLRDVTLAIGLLQFIYAFLSSFDRLNPTIRSSVYLIEVTTNDTFWAGAFLVTSIWVAVSLRKPHLRPSATGMSAANLLVWGVLVFAKSVTAIQPVAWSVGLAAVVLGFVAYKLCIIWTNLKYDPIARVA